MTLIAAWAERPQPMDATASLAAAYRRFAEDPGLCALPVVHEGRALGVLDRHMVLEAGPSESPATALMTRPRLLATDLAPDQALMVLMADVGGTLPLVVTHEGRYLGLITERSLLARLEGESTTAAAAPSVAKSADAVFAEMLSRELRTPLTGVLAVADLLHRQPLNPDGLAYVQTIVDSASTMIRVLDDALDLALGENGKLECKPGPVQLRSLVDDIQAYWQARRVSGVPVLVSYDGDPDLDVEADGGRLRQVFDNLIAAALKTTRQGAVEATLKARPTPAGVELEGRVRDGGPGLAPEHLARLFEPSAFGDAGPRAGWGGLGPALCRRVMEAMDGSIRAESNVGEGVTVSFTLLAPKLEAVTAATPRPGPVSAEDGGSVHVLVVDDNATNRMVAEGLCEMFHCTSECAEDGVEALEAAKSGRFDLILMDIKMPRMDGLEATKAIRQLPGAAGQVPIIALTANADPDDARTYVASGMASVVEKPIKPERLLTAMNEALGGKGARVGRAA